VFPIHARRKQLYIPVDVWDRHGANLDDIFAGHVTPQMHAGLAEMRELARLHLAELGRYGAQVPMQASPAFLPVALVPSALARMEGPRYDPFNVVELPQWRRQWILWRAASRDFPC
jgi:15-cis-phytoene synthase